MRTDCRGLLLLMLVAATVAVPARAFDSGLLRFTVSYDQIVIPYRVFTVTAMPQTRHVIKLSVPGNVSSQTDIAVAGSGTRWEFVAPMTPGVRSLTVRANGEEMRLQVIVLRPATEIKDGVLNNYRIGNYRAQPLNNLAVYRKPVGFIEVTEKLAELRVSPHFTLGAFLCKQESGWPKYMLLREPLLLKLENTLQLLNYAGIKTDSLEIMSGYRTPFYNRAIGNRTDYSRHLYGGAADIYVDVAPRDGVMDDLNGDGKINRDDARWLHKLLDDWSRTENANGLHGGLSHYRANAAHGPFVHIDTRGWRARW